jgi:hypothetical protein
MHCRQRRRLEARRSNSKLGILEAVEEVGVETFLSDRESTPGSLPSLEGYHHHSRATAEDRRRSETNKTSSGSSATTVRRAREESTASSGGSAGPGAGWLSDFDARYLGALDDFDELEDIEPGFLTTTGTLLALHSTNEQIPTGTAGVCTWEDTPAYPPPPPSRGG